MDRKYVMTALGYGLVGLLFGIYMAHSKNHTQIVTHAHILLVGMVISFIYAVCYKLWLSATPSKLATIQFYCHQLGTLVMLIALFLLFGGFVAENVLGPILGIATLAVFIGMLLLKILFIKSKTVI